jgi:hypothetical protein
MERDKYIYEEMHVSKLLMVTITIGLIIAALCIAFFITAGVTEIYNLITK